MIEEVVAAISAGEPAVIPTDTVYGLAATAYREEAARRLYRLKGRDDVQPTAVLAADLEMLFECVPELRGGRAGRIAARLLPGPYTLVLPNPAQRYRWLNGETPDRIGVRVPELPALARAVLDRTGAVVATSANLRGGRDPRRLEDVPEQIRSRVPCLDAGVLPGTPSTVIDFSAPDPVVLRAGAGDVERALAAAR